MGKIREINVGTTRRRHFPNDNTYQHRLVMDDVSNIEKRAGTYAFRQIAKVGLIYEDTYAKLLERAHARYFQPFVTRIRATLKIRVGVPNCRVEICCLIGLYPIKWSVRQCWLEQVREGNWLTLTR
jgi:hypothetical protein